MAIYIPKYAGSDITGSALTYASGSNTMVGLVNTHMQNFTLKSYYTITIDSSVDSTKVIELPHRRIVLGTVTIEGTAVASTIDYEAGIITFDNALPTTTTLKVHYSYQYWGTDQVMLAINSAIGALFPSFYIQAADTTQQTSSELFEYAAPVGTEYIRQIDKRASVADPWKRVSPKRYESFDSGVTRTVRFYSAPGAGYLRMHVIQRPQPFAAGDQTFADIGLPERASVPILFYSVWHLLKGQTAKRTKLDTVYTQQSGQQLSPRQIEDAAEAYRMAFQVELMQRKMKPWSGA